MRSVAVYLLLILALPGLLIGQEEGGQGSAPAVIPAAVKERLARLLPEPSEVGASQSGEQKFFSSDLYEYIDGGADVYLDYGLVVMVHQEYKASRTDITLDIYNMGAQSNASGFMPRKARRITTSCPSGRKAMAPTKS